MQAKDLLNMFQKHPEAQIVMVSQANLDESMIGLPSTVHFYSKGQEVQEGAFDVTDFVSPEDGTALVDLIIFA